MTPPVDPLIEALRQELQHFGEILALLEAGPGELDPTPGVRDVVAALAALQRQGAALAVARRQRLEIQSRFAVAVDRPDESSLHALLPEVPVEYRPLLRALGEEIEDLLTRLRLQTKLSYTHLHSAADQLEGLIDFVADAPAGARPVPQSLNA